MRPDWEEYFMKITEMVATRTTCIRRGVGAVIVKDNNIIALGYNGTPSGFDNCCEDKVITDFKVKEVSMNPNGNGEIRGTIENFELKTRPEVLHAESNAISKCARSTYSSEGADIFVTTAPCIECAKLIIQAGIKNVFWSEEYKSMDGIRLLEKANIYVKRVIVKLEPVLIKLNNEISEEQKEEFRKQWQELSGKSIWFNPTDEKDIDIEFVSDTKYDWYKKLLNKLKFIEQHEKNGELIRHYIIEVEEKIKNFENLKQ
jgi:dCMP deaminase